MSIAIDNDVEAAARYLQEQFPATRLVPIAEALHALAPILWGRYGREDVSVLSINPSAARTPATASQ